MQYPQIFGKFLQGCFYPDTAAPIRPSYCASRASFRNCNTFGGSFPNRGTASVVACQPVSFVQTKSASRFEKEKYQMKSEIFSENVSKL
jgi:hypothetical protein